MNKDENASAAFLLSVLLLVVLVTSFIIIIGIDVDRQNYKGELIKAKVAHYDEYGRFHLNSEKK